MKTEFTIKHSNYMMTIAEYIEGVEQITEAKVIKISEAGGKLTFTLEYPEPEPDYPECRGCNGKGPLTDSGYCSHCYSEWHS